MEFVCTLGTPQGRVIEEVHEAGSEEAARKELVRQGYHVFKIRRGGALGSFSLPRFGRRGRRISEETLLLFNQELAALLRAGLPILQALEIMLRRQREPLFHEVLTQVRSKVENGADLSDAFEDFADLLPRIYPQTLKAGERSGELEQVIRRFVRYQSLVTSTRRKVVSALVYPALLVALSLALIGVMTVFVVPKFSDFFSNMESDLPLITRVTVAVSAFLGDNWLWMSLAALAVVIGATSLSRSRRGAQMLGALRLRLPLLGNLFQKMALSEFSRALSTLLSGGIPLVSALESSVEAVSNVHIRRQLEPTVAAVREGNALHASLEASGVVPEVVIEMATVGEETGDLDTMLTNASEFLDEEVETSLQRILTLLEPLLLVMMGVIVAILLVSIYLPLFSALGQVRS
ncbi:MAG: type II secretion system F family protein [Acidobacteriota bacterium]|nr:type II secretion system F family protein [Acidobacteriota bacterium]